MLALATGAGGALSGCAPLPSLGGRTASTAPTGTGATRIGQAVAALAAPHPGLTGVYALRDGRDAFAARMLLAQGAERSLDVQYYIWRKDITGTLLMSALRAAADRGVRVRLLLDDNGTAGLDPTLAMLDAHPNIEVRLFNPFVLRKPRVLGYLTDFSRLNRRMHNKSFTADNQATIVGGRNIGDEYFGAAGELLFADLDAMAIGPVVGSVSNDFDRYWNSASAYPLALLVPPAGRESVAELDRENARTLGSAPALVFMKTLADSSFVAQFNTHRLALEWADARLVSDDPVKALGRAAPGTRVAQDLRQSLGNPVSELTVVSAYFVPSKASVDALVAMARRGVKVQVLTNSLEATDVAAVHAGYAKSRKQLLAAGVSLFELRRSWAADEQSRRAGRFGSSASSLHAKTFFADGARVFIGSFNFDPRSAELNTEMGLLIDSAPLAERIGAAIRRRAPGRAYEVHLAPDGSLYWIEHGPDGTIRHDTEPGTGFWKRMAVRLLSLLPIDWLL
jgi:cardiolipin synthase C